MVAVFLAHCFDKQLSNTFLEIRKYSRSGRFWWESEGAGVFGYCSSLDAKGSFFARTFVVVLVSCCIFSFKKS